jgi:hypothetical protein
MKQIGVRLEEELIKRTKQYGLDNMLSLQNIISEALTSYLDNKLSPAPPESDSNMITSKQDNKLESKHDNKLKEKKKLTPEEEHALYIKEQLKHPKAKLIIDEDGNESIYIDDSPEWQNKKLNPQDFYPTIEEKPVHTLDPNDPLDKLMLDSGMY